MKLIVAAAIVALAFTTGFTCSKNAPEATPAEQTAPAMEAAPAEGTAAPTEAAPTEAAPAETAPEAAPSH